ncbi:MAG: sigma-54 dependent transcriptional regulator [Rhodothermales bacterium]|nr:sigma-54 dependent transcriptional regulator [Rhodothermales bacterium]
MTLLDPVRWLPSTDYRPLSTDPMSLGHVLVIDDNEDILTAVRLLLGARGFEVTTATSPDALPALLREQRFDALLLDMNFQRDASSGKEGLHWLDRILTHDPAAAVVMITAYGDVDLAVRAMKRGAVDFVTKPWQNEKLVATITAAMRLRRTRDEAERLRAQRDRLGEDLSGQLGELLGESQAMQRVFETVRKVAPTDANVLVLGENGTGKELVARALHRLSARTDEVFVAVDLGALSESLFESELFGYVRGAFTGADEDRPGRFEVASGGTLFLDEIGNIGPAQQQKLLTALQKREVVRVGAAKPRPVDVRLVSATNRPLYEMVRDGTFRQDLLYRINTVEIHLPPLREREGDLRLLAEHFLARYAQKYDKPVAGFSEGAFEKMEAYPWPGNVRELQHTVERAVILADGSTLQAADLLFSAADEAQADADRGQAPLALETFDLERIEREVIRKALTKHGGNISRAAEARGLTRKSLYRRIEKYGL